MKPYVSRIPLCLHQVIDVSFQRIYYTRGQPNDTNSDDICRTYFQLVRTFLPILVLAIDLKHRSRLERERERERRDTKSRES